MLDALEQAKVCDLVRVGCAREAAAKYAGLTLEQLEAEIVRDDEFAKALLRAEGTAVLAYMGNIRKAASDEKNWRSSAWWLEKQARIDKLSGQDRSKLTEAVLETLELFAELIVAEVTDLQRRSALLVKLTNIAARGVGKGDGAQTIDVEPTALTVSPAAEQGSAAAVAPQKEAGND